PNTIYVIDNEVYVGDKVIFYVNSTIKNYDVYRLMWDFHDNTSIIVTTPDEEEIDHQFDDPGRYLVSILILQYAENITNSKSRIFTIPIIVQPKTRTLEIKSINEANEDELIDFYVHAPYINVSQQVESQEWRFIEVEPSFPTEIKEYYWEFGDGTVKTGKQVSHLFSCAGTFNIRVRGYDETNMVYTGYKTIIINNEKPQALFEVSKSEIIEDGVITFNASKTTDSISDLDSLKYIWEFGDGLMAEGLIVSHQYCEEGIYNVTLTVIDDDGERSVKTQLINVQNQIPVLKDITLSKKYLYEGETLYCVADLLESQSDLINLLYNWNINSDSIAPSIPIYDNGTSYIQLNVTDNNGAISNDVESYCLISNLPPIVSLINGTCTYDLSFEVWGTRYSQLTFAIYRNDKLYLNNSIPSTSSSQDNITAVHKFTYTNLTQPLEEYWDILIDVNSFSPSYDN
ncbi:MAG: PKD domain-containing protein, partial [Candidatus Hodarchaeota archaeon]